jgi:hypothetical protein
LLVGGAKEKELTHKARNNEEIGAALSFTHTHALAKINGISAANFLKALHHVKWLLRLRRIIEKSSGACLNNKSCRP